MSTELHSHAVQCIALASRVLSNELSLVEFRKQWPIEADEDRLLWRFMHEVEHYLIDSEIRTSDSSYEEYQRRVIGELRQQVVNKYDLQGTPS